MSDHSFETPRPIRVTGWTPAIFDRCESDIPGREGEPTVPLFACRLCGCLFAGPWQDNPAGFAHECSIPETTTVTVTKLAP